MKRWLVVRGKSRISVVESEARPQRADSHGVTYEIPEGVALDDSASIEQKRAVWAQVKPKARKKYRPMPREQRDWLVLKAANRMR